MNAIESITLENISAHIVGNKANGGQLKLAASELHINDEDFKDSLKNYFIKNCKSDQFYRFTFANQQLEHNVVCNYVESIFNDKSIFHQKSQELATFLYDKTDHPNIKAGEFYLVYFSDVDFEGEMCDAIGIYKMEKKESFIKLHANSGDFTLTCDNGVALNKLDKACLVYNVNGDDGYICEVIDNISKTDSHFWFGDFLNVEPCEDAYHNTRKMIQLTKGFIEESLPASQGFDKPMQIETLNKTADYFKQHETFNVKEFAQEVLNDDQSLIASFNDYKSQLAEDVSLNYFDEFEISPKAVKKESKNFKSVLKLDKNFHVYIHGDRKLIEKGVDEEGRRFYKLFYEEEA